LFIFQLCSRGCIIQVTVSDLRRLNLVPVVSLEASSK